MIFDIVEYIIIEWTMPNESRICKHMQEGAYPKTKRRLLLTSLQQFKYKSETYCWTKKINREDYGVESTGVLPAVAKE